MPVVVACDAWSSRAMPPPREPAARVSRATRHRPHPAPSRRAAPGTFPPGGTSRAARSFSELSAPGVRRVFGHGDGYGVTIQGRLPTFRVLDPRAAPVPSADPVRHPWQ